ncbi:MAG: hypothetical protein ACOCQR_00170 [bacterium]
MLDSMMQVNFFLLGLTVLMVIIRIVIVLVRRVIYKKISTESALKEIGVGLFILTLVILVAKGLSIDFSTIFFS